MESQEIISDTEPLLTRGHVPTDSRSSITDHEPSAPREGAEGGKKTSEPPATYAPVTARDGEDLKIRIATSVQQARHLLQQVRQEPESVATSQGGGNAATRGRTADHVLRQQQLGRQPALARGRMAAGYGSTGSAIGWEARQSTMEPSDSKPLSYGTIEPPPYGVVYEQGAQYQPAPPTYQSAGPRINPTVQQPRPQRREIWYSEGLFGRNYNIQQPEPGRMVISGYKLKKYGIVWYTGYIYADHLPGCFYAFLTCAVILAILATPLSLLCTVPSLIWMNKAREEADLGNVQEARENYRFAKWSMIAANALLVLIIVSVGFGVGLNL